MNRKTVIFAGGLVTILWGIAHLFPTSSVIRGFGNISTDNTRIITMEWINEGLTLIFIGLLVIVTAIIISSNNIVAKSVYLLSFFMLLAMSVLSLLTGYKIDFLPFRLCPLIFMFSGLLILQVVFTRKRV